MLPEKCAICATHILANPSRSIYVGATRDLERRMVEHQTGHFEDAHPRRYGISRLVWWQECADWEAAHALELKLKNMHRSGKLDLVNEENPQWQDLSYALFGWSSSRFKRREG